MHIYILLDKNNDTTDQCITDRQLVVNSCGFNTSLNSLDDLRSLSDTLMVRRPQGRLDYQMLYISMGQARHFLNGTWHTVRAGEMVLYRPGEPQVYSYDANMPILCQWVHFTGCYAAQLLEEFGFSQGTIFKIGEDREIQKLFTRMIQEYQLTQVYHEQLNAALLTQVLALMARDRQGFHEKVNHQTRQKIRDVVEHMNYHYAEPQSVSQYAEQCSMDRYHFIHAFHECVGQSPYAFLTALRMARAAELLSGSNMPVKEVASGCGYENPLYFSRAFSKHYGVSPTSYRKTHGLDRKEENEE